MKKAAYIVAALLLLALSHAVAASPMETVRNGEIFPSIRDAIEKTSLTPDQPVLITPIIAANGIRLNRLEGTVTGEVDYALVPLDAPLSMGRERPSLATKVYVNLGWGNTRCRLHLYKNTYYGTLLQTTDLDWVRMSTLSNLNDRVSSIKTTCRGAWFFKDHYFNTGNYYYYVPANTSLPSLPSQMNNSISSFLHDLD